MRGGSARKSFLCIFRFTLWGLEIRGDSWRCLEIVGDALEIPQNSDSVIFFCFLRPTREPTIGKEKKCLWFVSFERTNHQTIEPSWVKYNSSLSLSVCHDQIKKVVVENQAKNTKDRYVGRRYESGASLSEERVQRSNWRGGRRRTHRKQNWAKKKD